MPERPWALIIINLLEGAKDHHPWHSPEWQAICGDSLNPFDFDEAVMESPPPPLRREEMSHLKTFVECLLSKSPYSDEQARFLSRNQADIYERGRKAFKDYFAKNVPVWNLSGRISDMLDDYHPRAYLQQQRGQLSEVSKTF